MRIREAGVPDRFSVMFRSKSPETFLFFLKNFFYTLSFLFLLPFLFHVPDDIQGDVGVVQFALDAVVVQRDDVVQLGDGDVDVRVVAGVQGDAAHTDAVGEEQVRLGNVVA